MKQKKTRRFCLLLAALLLAGLTACGEKESENPDLLTFDDCTLLYKRAYITQDYDGNDAVVLALDFTNNSKENVSYLDGLCETAVQDDGKLDTAMIYTDYDARETLLSDQWVDAAPGQTQEIHTAFILDNTTDPVEVTFEELLGDKTGTITVDPSTLTREDPPDSGIGTDESSTESVETAETPESAESSESAGTAGPAETGDALRDWWNGEWYGWWRMDGCEGDYEGMDGSWWDICAVIDIGADYTGTVTLWDVDYTQSEPMALADVSLSGNGTGEHGTLSAEGGFFTDVDLAHADWTVDPALVDYEDMICITGSYESGDDRYEYEIYLRPWGMQWDDLVEDDLLPYYYDSWYLPLVEAGEPMPDSFETAAADTETA